MTDSNTPVPAAAVPGSTEPDDQAKSDPGGTAASTHEQQPLDTVTLLQQRVRSPNMLIYVQCSIIGLR